jgi:DNA-binding transcriptional LysR family regulator
MYKTAAAFDWNQARAFLATASTGSLSAAAGELGQTQPTLSRQVAALERDLGVTLFERVGKRLVLTDTGRGLVEHVRAMDEAAGMVSLSASGRSRALAGEVRITAGEVLSAYLLPPILERIRARYPELQVHLVVSNEVRDLRKREADIAIRHVRPTQPDLVAMKVQQTSAHLYAGKTWLRRHGRPKTLADLPPTAFVGGDDNERFAEVLNGLGLAVRVEDFAWTTDSHVVAWEMVRRGLGIGAMVKEIAARCPDVERVFPRLPPIDVPCWLCTHRELHTSQRIRVVFDLLAKSLRSASLASSR